MIFPCFFRKCSQNDNALGIAPSIHGRRGHAIVIPIRRGSGLGGDGGSAAGEHGVAVSRRWKATVLSKLTVGKDENHDNFDIESW